MFRLLMIASATALLLPAAAATADSDTWDKAKLRQVLINRATNAGLGNGGESFVYNPDPASEIDRLDKEFSALMTSSER